MTALSRRQSLALLPGVLLVILASRTTPALAAPPLNVVAAENFYADIAATLGGPLVSVTSILSDPNQDPHLFEASPSVATALAKADLAIENGVGYDPWMARLLAASQAPTRRVIDVGALVGAKEGDNPHIWYDPRTARRLAEILREAFSGSRPEARADIDARAGRFTAGLDRLEARIAALRPKVAGMPVTATEPVLGHLFARLGLEVRNERFQWAVMNDTEPSAADVAAFEDDLRHHRVRLLVYNAQATEPIAARMRDIAREAGIPVVGAYETEPPKTSYLDWIGTTLAALQKALLGEGKG
jgi:zinc/manganese transport system substrate-binding protein